MLSTNGSLSFVNSEEADGYDALGGKIQTTEIGGGEYVGNGGYGDVNGGGRSYERSKSHLGGTTSNLHCLYFHLDHPQVIIASFTTKIASNLTSSDVEGGSIQQRDKLAKNSLSEKIKFRIKKLSYPYTASKKTS
ncbi:hypothetical protein LIER_02725 [Lithospermum erythrorhizon]|uniref:Uncharacterized protein n=1 Tax=Lithospermum erythrorhizon TaxID=34254 RepID=A0AAV3NRN5_LITER